ncbi:MAG: type II toxin-antitoxin system prevent-host-death family antitoxin [Thermomicrobiales bacterium]
MPTIMSARRAKARYDALISQSGEGFDDIIVESNGEPRAVIVSFGEYERVLGIREARCQ